MVRRAALLLVLALSLPARADFVTDGTTITPKNDYKACPVGTDPTRCWSATDANQHADALVALRTHTTGWANARSYGLHCDGVQDDRAHLVAMLATLGATNRVVVFPGSCQISAGPGIAIPANLPSWFMGGGSFVGPGAAGVTYTPANIGLATVWTLDSSVGANCDAFGGPGAGTGQRVQSGLDNGDGGGVAGNYALEAGEVDATNYVCDGKQGPSAYDIWFVASKISTASQVLAYVPILRAMTIPASGGVCTGSRGYVGTLPTASRDSVFSYIRGGVTTAFATATITDAGVVTFACAGPLSLVAGDVIEWKAPAVLDSTLANVGLGLAGTLP